MVKFSIVCPIKEEVQLIPETLPSFYTVNPSEVILCLDKPAPRDVAEVIKRVSKACNKEEKTRIIEVERNPEYAFHQAWVRRKGFLQAKYDRILTTDIDLVINKNVLKAVEMVGNSNVGLVSCSKRYPFTGFQKIWRNIAYAVVRHVYPVRFTGLYSLWRPYWLDSEDEGIKKLRSRKRVRNRRREDLGEVKTGEDTYLRDCMIKKHRVIYLKDLGARVLTHNLADLPHIQFEDGRYFASQGYGIFRILAKAVTYWRFYLLRGWLYEKRRMKE